jgi:Tuberculosis necrotizing toxin
MKKLFLALALLAAHATAAHATCDAPLRPDLEMQWWNTSCSSSTLVWPGNNGSLSPAFTIVLPIGTLIDRFSQAPTAAADNGRYFSPKGEAFTRRAMPYTCGKLAYRVYRVVKPLSVSASIAAPWFGEKGGAMQFQTTDGVAQLLSTAVIEQETQGVEAPCGE